VLLDFIQWRMCVILDFARGGSELVINNGAVLVCYKVPEKVIKHGGLSM